MKIVLMAYGRVLNDMFRYPGGKSKLKKQITSIARSYFYSDGNYRSCRYVEPFFGGGSVGRELLDHVHKVAFNDFDIGVAAFWHSVINNPQELCDYINDFKPTIDDFYNFKSIFLQDNLRDMMLIDQKYSLCYLGFMKMVLHQISFSGLGAMSGGPLGGAEQKSAYKVDCRWNPIAMEKHIWKCHNQLKKMDVFEDTCLYDDFHVFTEKVLEQSDHNFIYLDPPYYIKGPQLYQFSFDIDDHNRLSEMLKTIDSPWLLSYDCLEEIREIYKWAAIAEIDVTNTINTRSGSVSKKEFLIVDKKYRYLLEKM